MNKFKKLAVAAVSVVMAGTMAASFTACGKDKETFYDPSDFNVLNADGTINYQTYKDREKVTLNIAIGHNSATTSTAFHDLGNVITLPNRATSYSDGQMKPAWEQMGADLNIEWNDVYGYQQTSKNLNWLLTTVENGVTKYSGTDLFTTDLSVAVSKSTSGEADILNLADYLDKMPNFKKFLSENPVVYLSLLQDGMNTTTGEGQKILVAPYFDGYNDIERYCIVRHDWVEKLLNGSTATGSTETAKSELYQKGIEGKTYQGTAAVSFMGSADYTVDALTADGTNTQKITKKYSAAKAAAADTSKPLGAAYNAIAGAAYTGESGNIVDIMNAAIKANENVTGAQLVDLYRAYIDVCYQDKDGNAVFTAANRAHVFTGYEACWDVDDLVAILRCVKTNTKLFEFKNSKDKVGAIGGIAPRSGESDRTSDIVSLACQLYGVRGGTSRNEFTYIANDGSLKDARADKNFYQAMANLNTLFQEGLVADYSSKANFATGSGIDTKSGNQDQYFMVYDYSQTQTINGFYAEENVAGGPDLHEDYYFSPVITPVSKWDVDANGTIAAGEYFRFTESWRSTKTGGLSANGAVRKNQAKLDATLQFIDYLYSEDGRIVSTYGPMASNAAGEGGFWYNEKAGANDTGVFTYKGVKYKGVAYKDTFTPKLTDNLLKSFKGETVNGWKVGDNSKVSNSKLNFTNYARQLIGSTLPIGVKDQSFENQLTSKMGQKGANIVGVALAKGVVKGMSLDIKDGNWWYTCVPTGLPVTSADQTALDNTTQKPFMYLTGTQKDGKGFFSIMNWIVLNGVASSYNEQDVAVTYTSIDNLLEQTLGTTKVQALATQREAIYDRAWKTAKSYWTFLSK